MYEHFLNLLFPKHCIQCCAVVLDILFCYECLIVQKPLLSEVVSLVGARKLANFSLFKYEGSLRKIVKSKFYYDRSLIKLAAKTTFEIADNFLPLNFFQDAVLIPIPIHWTRLFKRGFNQAEILCSELSQYFEIRSVPLLKRKKKTLFQAQLGIQNRWHNVKDAFVVDGALLTEIKGKKLIIVDDLFTTGATLKSAAETLIKKNKDLNVVGFTVCKGV